MAEVKNKKKKATKSVKKEGYFKSVRKEMKNVKWPDFKTMLKYTVATFAFCIFFGLMFFGLDTLFALLKGMFN